MNFEPRDIRQGLGMMERLRRVVGLGTDRVVGMERSTPEQQRLARVMHDRGGEGFWRPAHLAGLGNFALRDGEGPMPPTD